MHPDLALLARACRVRITALEKVLFKLLLLWKTSRAMYLCSMLLLCPNAATACTLLPASFICSSVNSAIPFAPASAVLVLPVPGGVDSFSCMFLPSLQVWYAWKILMCVHHERVGNLWSLMYLVIPDTVSLILPKTPGKKFPGYRHDHGDNAKSKASVQWLSRLDQWLVVYGNVLYEFTMTGFSWLSSCCYSFQVPKEKKKRRMRILRSGLAIIVFRNTCDWRERGLLEHRDRAFIDFRMPARV